MLLNYVMSCKAKVVDFVYFEEYKKYICTQNILKRKESHGYIYRLFDFTTFPKTKRLL